MQTVMAINALHNDEELAALQSRVEGVMIDLLDIGNLLWP